MNDSSRIQWLEKWITSGVCLLARSEIRNRGVIGGIANRLMSPSGLWVYVHKNEAVLIDAPFAWEDSEQIIPQISDFLQRHNLQLKFITASHLHLDHSAGLVCLLNNFNTASFIYPAKWQQHWKSVTIDRIKYGFQPAMAQQWEREPHKLYDKYLTTDLAGEPLYFIVAPYHSLTDQLVVFRGFVLLPDWHLPTHIDEPLQLVNAPTSDVADTLVRFQQFERETGYRIHQSCAVHGDEPLRSDFQERLAIAYNRFVTRCCF